MYKIRPESIQASITDDVRVSLAALAQRAASPNRETKSPMKLILPSKNYQQSYIAFIQELGDEERYPFPLDFEHRDFDALLSKLDNFHHGIDIPQDFVPSTTYWLVRGSDIVGVTNIRHYLNDRIRQAGGHIGLGIRPSYRGQGLGRLLMKLSIDKAFAMGTNPVHIHCYKDNPASARAIIANGGVLDSEIVDGDKVVLRFLVWPVGAHGDPGE